MAQYILLRDKNIVEIRPANYIEGKKYPTFNFHHGIGESGDRKTLDQLSTFHKFLDKWADGLAGEEILFILAQDMDGNVSTTPHVPIAWKWADQYTDGRKGLGGLSMGGGETMIQATSSLYETVYADATFIMPICFPSWESMNEIPLSKDNKPFWTFMGAKDAAVSIASFVNTIGDIITAGRKPDSNFNVSIFPSGTHFIWEQVLGTAIPVNPDNSAKTWNGIADWAMVNDPKIRPMEYFLMQRKGDFKPLPRLGDAVPVPEPEPLPLPTPEPIPTPTAKVIKRVNATSAKMGISFQNEDNSPGGTLTGAIEVDAVRLKTGKVRVTIFGAAKKVLKTIEI